ncbi:MAG TPA: hypothetical protein VF940_04335, partial [Streptosporangiaceae bacterium]
VVHADPQVAVLLRITRARGERYSVYNHAYHPRHYGDPVREYLGAAGGRDDVGRGRRAADCCASLVMVTERRS